MRLLSEDFHIIQNKDGCLLGVDGKCEAFEEKPLDSKDYIWWIDGFAFRHDHRARIQPTVVLDDEGALELRDAPFFSTFITSLSIDEKSLRKQ